MKNRFIWLLPMLWCYCASAQYRISGYIEDVRTREKLYGATVQIMGTAKGSSANFHGYFTFETDQAECQLLVSYVGYQQKIIDLSLKSDTILTIALDQVKELEAVTVEGDRMEAVELQPRVSTITIPSKQLLRLPAIAGEIDLLRALQLLPGVQSGKEGMTGIYVRGGGPDQNLILMDGVPLYSVSHLGGLFSVFNPDVIADVNLIKGGFPARYGGRLSSVIDVRTKDGSKDKIHGVGAIGLVSARATVEGPLDKAKNGSFMLGVRRTYIDLFMRPLTRLASDGEFTAGYLFYDLNSKLSYQLTDKDKLQLSVYTGDDRGVMKFEDSEDSEGKARIQWGNVLTAARWTHLFSDQWFTNLTVSYNRYRFLIGMDLREEKDEFAYEYTSGIWDWSLRYEVEYYRSDQHQLLSGVQAIAHYFKPGVTAFRSETDTDDDSERMDSTFGSFNIRSKELSWYLEDQWKISSRVSANIGIHLNGYFPEGKAFFSPQPRVTLRVMTGRRSSWKASFATMQQNVHLLSSSSGLGLPTDLWMPATNKVAPQHSEQITTSYNQSLTKSIDFTVELYYKQMSNLIAYSQGEDWLSDASDWQEKVEVDGEGVSKGLELLLHKKEGKFTGWVGYTLSKTDRQFDNLNHGERFPFRYDRRHDIGINLAYKISDRLDISATWVYGTGNGITLGTARYLAMGYDQTPWLTNSPEEQGYSNSEVEVYEGINSFRMRAYHRSDLGLRFSKEKNRVTRTWNLGFYNVYNRANPFYYYWSEDYNYDTGSNQRKLKQIALFPIIPAFSYEIKF